MSFPVSEMVDSVSVKPYTGQSAYGPVFGDAYDLACYVEPGLQRVVDDKGQESVASVTLFCAASATISVGDEVTWQGNRHEVVSVLEYRPRGIAHHEEVMLRSAAAEV